MSWLQDTINNVKRSFDDEGEVTKKENIVKKTHEELATYQEHPIFPSDEQIEEWMEQYRREIDIFTVLEILIDNGLTSREEYYEKRERLESELRSEVKKEIMDDLQAQRNG